jgi:hypothetical protein
MKIDEESNPMIPPSNPDKPPLESAKRSIAVDMSPAAIDRRLRDVFELWEFCRFLRQFRPVPSTNAHLEAPSKTVK